MKVNFSQKVKYIPTWRGNDKLPEAEQITAELTVLSMGSLMEVLDAFTRAGLGGKVNPEELSSEQVKPVLEQFGDLLPKHIVISNLTDNDGAPLSIDQVVGYPFFLNLSMELLMKLTDISSPTDEDAKN